MYIHVRCLLSRWAGHFGSLREILALVEKGAVHIRGYPERPKTYPNLGDDITLANSWMLAESSQKSLPNVP